MGRFSQPQVTHNDDYHLTTAKRDTANGVCGIDASKEVINDVPVSKIVDMNTQSFDSLIDNGDFELWSSGVALPPDDWSYAESGSGGGVALSTTHKIGTYSAEITKSDSGNSILSTTISDYARYAGIKITIGCWVKSANSVSNQIKLQIYDGVDSSNVYYQNTGDWEFLNLTHTVNSSPNQLKTNLVVITGSDAVSFFDGAILVEGVLCPSFSLKPLTDKSTYGEMYIYNNSTATVIETADIPVALREISEGSNSGFIFHAGSTGAITAYADYSGTVAGAVLITDAGHGLTTGDIITIRGTINYNGIFAVTVVSVDTFYIIDTWVVDDGASDWDQGASLTAQSGSSGIYTSTWQMTTSPVSACELCFKVNINETPQNKSTACRDMAINDKDNNSSTCLLDIAENDIIWLSIQSDSASNLTNSMGNINLERLCS